MNRIPTNSLISAIRSLNLRSRIYISTGLLVGVCCIASGIGWIGQSVLLQNFGDHERAEIVSARVLEIDRNVQELKAQSETYIHSGTESTRGRANGILAELVDQIAETKLVSEDVDLASLLDEMTLHLTAFGEQLELAAKERGIRTAIVNRQLPEKASEVRLAIDALKESIKEQGTSQSAHRLLEVAQAIEEGRMHLMRYLIDPGANQLDSMLVDLKRAEAHAHAISISHSEFREEVEGLSQKLVEFRQLSLRAAQATRGYLYYANVVMAGEISEFVYYSNQVKQFVAAQRQLNLNARTVAASRTRTLCIIASLAALMFAGLLATGLSYSIVRPLSLLTDAFRRLASGETLTDIPGTYRTDEIGRMSRAAQVFSAKNQETKDLLAQSQSLSSELEAKARALEETNLELDNFAYVASHDLKAPLRGINSLAQWVHEDCSDMLPDDSKRHLDQMQDRVRKMDVLLNDLLEYSRVGRIEQKTELVDLQELVASIIELSDTKTGVRFEITSPLPTIKTAIAPLKQVLLNLIANAVKYNDKGMDGWIKIDCEDLNNELRISVTDNGVGIDPRYHERIFQMYQRVASANVEGSGMGLAIVKKQVEHHGGCLTLQSEEGSGCRFAFTWPKEESSAAGIDDGPHESETVDVLESV